MKKVLCIFFLFLGLLLPMMTLGAKEKILFVSTSGDDNNPGDSEDHPLKTISLALEKGDIVMLKAGDVFFETLLIKNKKIGKYGKGKNPIVSGFKRILNPNWQNVGSNIWRISLVENNYEGFLLEGSSAYNGVGCIYEYDMDELHGHRVKEKRQLVANWDFWQTEYYDNETSPSVFDDLFLYLDKNPNQLKLEFSISAAAAIVENSTIEDVDFIGFGFGLSCSSNVTIRNCKLDIIGGRIINGEKNVCCYGNGIEFYMGPSIRDCLVEGCYISRCFDCGITIQSVPTTSSYGMSAFPENIIIRNNLITNCCQGWEEYLNNSTYSRFENCVFEKNIVINSGESGWGYENGRKRFCHVLNTNIYGNKGMVLRNNIFAGGNFINSLYINNSYVSDIWENNIVYIAYGYDLVRDPDARERIVRLSDSSTRKKSIEEYRSLTGDYSTEFHIYNDKRVKKIAKSLKENFLKNHSN